MTDLNILSDDEIKSRLTTLPGWEYQDAKIIKKFQFPSFQEAVNFVDKLAPICNQLDHHPDIHIYYKDIVFELQRFDVGGHVTPMDFKVATGIERLYMIGKNNK